MAKSARRPGALDDVRVIDLCGPIGWYATRLLADLGADVIRVEPAGGDPARGRRAFGVRDERVSLSYWWHNAGKRFLTLDLERAEGRASLFELIAEADMLVESFPVGWLSDHGLSIESLQERNPRLVVTSITPFGQTGPRAMWRGTDLIGMATGGLVHLGGLPDRPPTHLGGEQGFFQAGLVAAAASLIALRDARSTGTGRHVDVSLQDAIVFTTENNIALLDLMGLLRARLGDRAFTGFSLFFPCRDGWLAFWPGGRFDGLLEWLEEMGVESAPFQGGEWSNPSFRE